MAKPGSWQRGKGSGQKVPGDLGHLNAARHLPGPAQDRHPEPQRQEAERMVSTRSKIRPAVSPSRRLPAVSRTSAHTAEGGQVAPGWPHLKSHHTAAEHHFPFPQGTRGTLRTLVWGGLSLASVRVFKAKPAPNSRNTQMGDSRATGVEGSKGLLKQNEGNQLLPGANATPATQPSWEPRQLQLQLATWEGGTGCCSGSCKGMLVPPPP